MTPRICNHEVMIHVHKVQKSVINFFLPVVTDKGLIRCGSDDTLDMHPSCKSLFIAYCRRLNGPTLIRCSWQSNVVEISQ